MLSQRGNIFSFYKKCQIFFFRNARFLSKSDCGTLHLYQHCLRVLSCLWEEFWCWIRLFLIHEGYSDFVTSCVSFDEFNFSTNLYSSSKLLSSFGIKLFIILPCELFNVCRIDNNCFTLDIDNLCALYIFNKFCWYFKRPSIEFYGFCLFFKSVFQFTDLCSHLYLTTYFVYIFFLSGNF